MGGWKARRLASPILKAGVGGIRLPCGSMAKNRPANAGDSGSIPGSGRSLEKEMTTHFHILAWEIQWTEEPGGLQSMALPRVGHDLLTLQGGAITWTKR